MQGTWNAVMLAFWGQRVAETFFFYFFVQLAFYAYHRILHMPWAGPLYRMHHIQHHKVCFPLKRLRALAYGAEPCAEAALPSDGASSELCGGPGLSTGPTVRETGGAGTQGVAPGVAPGVASDKKLKCAAAPAPPHSDGWFQSGGELLFGVPMLAVGALAVQQLPLATALVFIGVMVFVAVWGDVMHSSFHLYDNAVSHPESLALHHQLVRAAWFRRYQHLHDIHHARTHCNFGFFDFTFDKLFGTFSDSRPAYLPVPPTSAPEHEHEYEHEQVHEQR